MSDENPRKNSLLKLSHFCKHEERAISTHSCIESSEILFALKQELYIHGAMLVIRKNWSF